MNKLFILFLIIFVLGFSKHFPEKKTNKYNLIIKEKKMLVYYKIKDNMIFFKLVARTKGWVAIGFNPKLIMKGANIIIGYVKKNKTYIFDHYGTGIISHKIDTSIGGKNDVTNISGYEKNELTELKFSIPLNSKDKYDTEIKLNKKTVVLLAFGRSDNMKKRHIYRKKLKVVFKKKK